MYAADATPHMSSGEKPLATVRDELRVEWYRSPVPPAKLRELMKRSDLQGWWQSAGHLALVIGTGLLTYSFWQQQSWLAFRRRVVRLWDLQQLPARRGGT